MTGGSGNADTVQRNLRRQKKNLIVYGKGLRRVDQFAVAHREAARTPRGEGRGRRRKALFRTADVRVEWR